MPVAAIVYQLYLKNSKKSGHFTRPVVSAPLSQPLGTNSNPPGSWATSLMRTSSIQPRIADNRPLRRSFQRCLIVKRAGQVAADLHRAQPTSGLKEKLSADRARGKNLVLRRAASRMATSAHFILCTVCENFLRCACDHSWVAREPGRSTAAACASRTVEFAAQKEIGRCQKHCWVTKSGSSIRSS